MRMETDDEYRSRLLGIISEGSIHRNSVEAGGGLELDAIGRHYEDGTRKQVEEQPNVVALPTQPTDAERADEYRAALRPVLEEVCRLVGQARGEGLQINFNLAPDSYGRFSIQALDVLKVL